MAFARPVVEPPPTATQQSAPSALACSLRLLGDLDRHVHHGLVEQAGGARAQPIHHLLSFFALLGRRQHQRAGGAQPLDFFG